MNTTSAVWGGLPLWWPLSGSYHPQVSSRLGSREGCGTAPSGGWGSFRTALLGIMVQQQPDLCS